MVSMEKALDSWVAVLRERVNLPLQVRWHTGPGPEVPADAPTWRLGHFDHPAVDVITDCP